MSPRALGLTSIKEEPRAYLLASVMRTDWASGSKGCRTEAVVRASLRTEKASVWAGVQE